MMAKGNILFISRTPWYEPPRLRHQLSRMLRDMGYEITYLETLFNKKGSHAGEQGISVHTVKELNHHQLQPFGFLNALGARYAIRQMKKIIGERKFILVFNFNYDFSFLQSLLPGVPVVTVINDDFITMAKPWMKRAAERYLRSTVGLASHVLSVSYPLHHYLEQITPNSSLLLPWSEKEYRRPEMNRERKVALYYGYVSRLDESIIEGLLKKGFVLRFVGPLEGNGITLKKKYEGVDGITFLPPSAIESIDVSDVCCSIAPYDMKNEFIKAATASNRLFRLLALGIPFVCSVMPNLINAPDKVIRQCDSTEAFAEAIKYFQDHFDEVQTDIQHFLEGHTAQSRKELVEQLIAKLTDTAHLEGTPAR